MIKFITTKAIGTESFAPYLKVSLVKMDAEDNIVHTYGEFSIPLEVTNEEQLSLSREVLQFFDLIKGE